MSRCGAWSHRVALVTLGLVAAALAGDGAPEAGTRTTDVAFDVLVTESGGPTRRLGSLLVAGLRPGQGTGRQYVTAAPGLLAGGCGGASVAASLSPPTPGHGTTWAVEARVRDTAVGETTLDVRWSRLGHPAEAPPTAEAAWAPFTLEHGDRALVDFVPLAGGACVRSFALELSARQPGAPGLEARTIDWEIWLLHEVGSKRRASRSFRSSSRQGDRSAFRFQGLPFGPARDAHGAVTIEGDVRGWVRTDGRVDVVVSARRHAALDGGASALTEAGRKATTVSPGEAVRMSLPDVTPTLGADPRLVEAIAGHSFALVLVGRPRPASD